MLPFNNKAVEAIARKEGGTDGKAKLFCVHHGMVIVYSGRVLAAVTNFSPLDNGQYEFGTNDKATGQALLPWLVLRRETRRPWRVPIKLALVARLYKTLKAWYGCKPKDPKVDPKDENPEPPWLPYANLSFNQTGPWTFTLRLELEGNEQLPFFDLEIPVGISDRERYANREFAFNAKELLDALSLYGKLKAEEGELFIEYSDDPNEPIFLYAESDGHEITVGLPFDVQKKKDQPTHDAAEDDEEDSDDEDGDDEHDRQGKAFLNDVFQKVSDKLAEKGDSLVTLNGTRTIIPFNRQSSASELGADPVADRVSDDSGGPGDQADGSDGDALREAAAAGALLGVDG